MAGLRVGHSFWKTREEADLSRNKKESRVVWSSEESGTASQEKPHPTPSKGDGVVRVSRQTKGRKGKGVTLISGVPLAGDELKDLAKALKQRCGSGGTIKDGIIEIQGDHRDTLVVELSKKNWIVKKSGG